MKLVYIGEHFYNESGSAMSSLYTEEGERADWGYISTALESGAEVHIRQATEIELARCEQKLRELKKNRTPFSTSGEAS